MPITSRKEFEEYKRQRIEQGISEKVGVREGAMNLGPVSIKALEDRVIQKVVDDIRAKETELAAYEGRQKSWAPQGWRQILVALGIAIVAAIAGSILS